MNLVINPKSKLPIYEQIEMQIKDEIISENLNPGDSLPSIRTLASDLKISVITTKRAYEDLEKEGFVYSVPRKGFFVDDPNITYMEEKRTAGIEEKISAVIEEAKKAEIDKSQFIDMIELLWE